MVKIYGIDTSLYSNKVKLSANAMGIEYEFEVINIASGDGKSPEYLKIHPAGKVPAMTDGDVTLFESSTIIRYLADKVESPLYPKEIKQRYAVDQWIEFSTIHVSTAVAKVLFNKVFAPMMEVPVDETSLQDGVKFYERFVTIVDDQLSRNKYLAGDALSLADTTLLAFLDPSEVVGLDITPYKNVVKWRDALKQEKFYTDSFTSYDDVLKGMMAEKAV